MTQWVKDLLAIWETKDTHLIPGSGRSPGGGHGNKLQYSFLEKNEQRRAEETGRLQSLGLKRVGHTEVTEHTNKHFLLLGIYLRDAFVLIAYT